MEKDSTRLCYWCIESPCLKKRTNHEEKKNGITRNKGEDYQDYRFRLDKATNHMCKKYKGIKARWETGAEVFQVNASQANNISNKEETKDEGEEIFQANTFLAHNGTSSTLTKEEEKNPNKLHCHESCVNYKRKCETPKECRQKRLSKKDCPISKHVGYHSCGMEQTMSRKDYNIEQRRREEDRQLHKKGPVEEEVRRGICYVICKKKKQNHKRRKDGYEYQAKQR